MKSFLKIKIKYLVAESKINKQFVGKTQQKTAKAKARVEAAGRYFRPGFLAHAAYRHRMDVVRPELRYSHLAYNFLRGRRYSQVESQCRQKPDWNRVFNIVKEFNSTQDGRGLNWYHTDMNQLEYDFIAWTQDPDVKDISQRSKKNKIRKPHNPVSPFHNQQKEPA